MAIRNRQIGWSNKSNLLYDVLREVNALKGQFAIPTTTTTTTAGSNSLMSIDLSTTELFFDIPYFNCNFGCWINMANDYTFPRIFSFGQYPTAAQAISIESNTLYFWYNGSIILSYPLTTYIGNWIWIWIVGSISGNITLWVNGQQVAFGYAPLQVSSIPSTIYIGSENASGTYLNGRIASLIFDVSILDYRIPPNLPIIPSANTVLLIGQGNDLATQESDQSVFARSISATNITYSIDSPYAPGDGGSLEFVQ